MNPQTLDQIPAANVGPVINELMQAFQTALLAIRDTNQAIQGIRTAGDQTFAHFETARAETTAREIELANEIRQQAEHVLNQEAHLARITARLDDIHRHSDSLPPRDPKFPQLNGK